MSEIKENIINQLVYNKSDFIHNSSEGAADDTAEGTSGENAKKQPQRVVLPVLASRGMVPYPETKMYFDVQRYISILAIKAAMQANRLLFIVSQNDISIDVPQKTDLYKTGVVCCIDDFTKLDDQTIRVSVKCLYRASVVEMVNIKPFMLAEVKRNDMTKGKATADEKEALMRVVKQSFITYLSALPNNNNSGLLNSVRAQKDPRNLLRLIMPNFMDSYENKQKILEAKSHPVALQYLAEFLQNECNILSIERGIYEQVKEHMDQNQRDYFLREQMRVIQEELGEEDSPQDEALDFVSVIASYKNISEDAREKLMRECERLSKMPAQSQEAAVIRSYLEVCTSLPWDEETEDTLDILKAAKQLDKDHYGLKRVKNRILELLAVRQLKPDVKGQIICLVGPPGVGKTSIAASVAKAIGRKYVRVSLGGVYDESEIRGHRKTYLGSMPGRIINAFRQAKVNNPLVLLDEIDKLSSDFRGDPSSAMLEVLDAEQNNAFVDHYVEIPFDLSKALFITTANNASEIPGPLYDRMEIIELASYTREEKFNIAKNYLVKKQREANGLSVAQLKISNSAIYKIIDEYTREAGVRTLERTIGSICRKAARKIVSGEAKTNSVTEKNISEYLGVARYRREEKKSEDLVGVVNGLAWTSVGGELLNIESVVMEGTGKIKITGSLGDVMKESAELAVSYARRIADKYGYSSDFYKNKDIHIHAPEGATPKDGPSAGVTMTTSLVSALSGIPVRGNMAMTGEITLTGRVTAIGGLREKAMAAYRENKNIVIIPKENLPDIEEIDDVVKASIQFIPVTDVKEVLELALMPPAVKAAKSDPESNIAWQQVESKSKPLNALI